MGNLLLCWGLMEACSEVRSVVLLIWDVFEVILSVIELRDKLKRLLL